MTSPPSVRRAQSLTADEVAGVRGIVAAAARHDRTMPISEEFRLRVTDVERPGVVHLIVGTPDGTPAGYAQVAGGVEATAELLVDPGQRGRGHGRALLDAVVDTAAGRLSLWSHGDQPAARHLAETSGFVASRELWQMRRSLRAGTPVDVPVLPGGVTVRPFVPGSDERAWLTVNAAAFATHPDQGRWTADDLLAREAEPWFDPAGFFLAERDGAVVGFHWTKIDPPDGDEGEVYVLGVLPAAAGGGLGRALTLVGLQHLKQRGLASVLLYVDADNLPAVAVYRRLGFEQAAVDVQYQHAHNSAAEPGSVPGER